MEKLSVIIATMNRERELRQCLSSLWKQTRLPDELVIVDDKTLEEGSIRPEVPEAVGFQYHRKSPPGLSASRNLGAEVATGSLLLFLDDDVELEPPFIEEILRVFAQDLRREVGAVSGIILNRKGKPLLFRYWARFFLLDRGRQGELLPWGFYSNVGMPKGVIDVDWVPGGLSCFRKEVFEEFHLSDFQQRGRFGGRHGLADVEFSWRVSRKYRLKVTPFARLYHYPSPRARERSMETGRKQALNHGLLFLEHGEQTLRNRICFAWAMTGLILGNLGAALFMRSSEDRQARLLLMLGNLQGLIAYRRAISERRSPVTRRSP